MITRFLFEGRLGTFSFDYLGPAWAFITFVLLVVVVLLLALVLLRLLS
jgi:hypothetical protein